MASFMLLFAVVPGAGTAAVDPNRLSFAPPVYLSTDPAFQAAEPSIREWITFVQQKGGKGLFD
ncbi:MAG TPA: hypothetical protein VHI54_02905 [Actinomycetota bacterium]|nr:hypothetical protein [Actinomycetota bacterium]